MHIERMTYTDFNGNKREENFYFNLTEAELAEMNYSIKGGLDKRIQQVQDAQDEPEIIAIMKEMILKAYGVKSNDGRTFIKNDQVRAEFAATQAYSDLFIRLATDEKAASEFFNGIVGANVTGSAPLSVVASNSAT